MTWTLTCEEQRWLKLAAGPWRDFILHLEKLHLKLLGSHAPLTLTSPHKHQKTWIATTAETTAVVAVTSRVGRSLDMVRSHPRPTPTSILLTCSQNANDPAHHHTTNAATTDDDLAPRLEVAVMHHHKDMTAPTTDLDPATHATAPRAHQSLAARVVAAHIVTHTQMAPSLELGNRLLRSPKHHAMCRWATVTKMRTQKPRWLA